MANIKQHIIEDWSFADADDVLRDGSDAEPLHIDDLIENRNSDLEDVEDPYQSAEEKEETIDVSFRILSKTCLSFY